MLRSPHDRGDAISDAKIRIRSCKRRDFVPSYARIAPMVCDRRKRYWVCRVVWRGLDQLDPVLPGAGALRTEDTCATLEAASAFAALNPERRVYDNLVGQFLPQVLPLPVRASSVKGALAACRAFGCNAAVTFADGQREAHCAKCGSWLRFS